jgi:hypothetical protein
MFYLIDYYQKVIFGWSAKCGCTHIKKIYYFLMNGEVDCAIHRNHEYVVDLPDDIENYTVVIICRSPYKRIVSGFLNKYSIDGPFRKGWKSETITFSTFVDEVIKKNWEVIDKHHFIPQTREKFNEEKIMKAKCVKCYDIEVIDYEYIEGLYNKKIPEKLLYFKGPHVRKQYDVDMNEPVYHLNMEDYYECNVDLGCFYNEELEKKVYDFYQNDFVFFKKFDIDYTSREP